MPALKGRFTDTNKNLAAQALGVLASVARAMGRPIAREARPILGPAVRCICDSKANVGWGRDAGCVACGCPWRRCLSGFRHAAVFALTTTHTWMPLACCSLTALQVRAAVIELLDAWVSVAPPDAVFDEVVEVLPSPKCVSEGMQVRGCARHLWGT
jgi:hypothetical protein